MKHYFTIDDIPDIPSWINRGLDWAQHPGKHGLSGKGKTLCLLFFNNSLRTRLSTQKAARNLGLEVMMMNVGSDGWSLEFEDGVRMDGQNAEHIREAAKVVGQYADLIGIRAFPGLKDRKADLAEKVLKGFMDYSGVPILNLESATAHPLQALADALTFEQYRTRERPKVVLSWAPHPRALPHAVPSSFLRMFRHLNTELVVTHPEGYELPEELTKGIPILHNQEEALKGADFVYVKNWSSYHSYGKVLTQDPSWTMTPGTLGEAYFMHCLPVRRTVVVEDAVLDGPQALIMQQAANRTLSATLALDYLLQQ